MANSDKVDIALSHGSENRDVGMTTQAENVLDPTLFEITNQVLGDGFVRHQATSRPKNSPNSSVSGGRSSGIG